MLHLKSYEPLVSDWSNFETWTENGEKTAFQRANEIYRQRLNDYQQPPVDDQIRISLEQYVNERRSELKSQK